MKILIVSNSPWRNDNSFGNSYSNLFDGIHEQFEIANVYLKHGTPDCTIVKTFFQISERSLIRNLLHPKYPTGERRLPDTTATNAEAKDARVFDKVRPFKGPLLIWARTVVWKIGRWKSRELKEFVDAFAPDLLFIPIYYSHYIHDINFWIKNRCGIPAVGYISDDNYSLRKISFNPLFWIDRLIMRRRLRKVFAACDIVYTISENQKEYLRQRFGDKFKVLTKYAEFDKSNKPAGSRPHAPLRMLYTGNLGSGRYSSLCLIAKALKQVNAHEQRIVFDIYTSTVLSERLRSRLNTAETTLHDAVSFEKVLELQRRADILVHVEGLSLKERLDVAHSFSTKIVDYLQQCKPIFVVGKDDCASIRYFIDNDSGIVAQNYDEIVRKLTAIAASPLILADYAEKAWTCGEKNHRKSIHQEALKNDLLNVVKQTNKTR